MAFWAGWSLSSGAVATQKSKTSSSKSSTKAKSTSKSKSKSTSSKSRRSAPTQTAPTPDRIQEIQQALTSHGFAVESTGALDAPTVDALKRFQQQQNLDPTGKLSSLTLIGLGLGPSQQTASVQANPPAAKD